MVLVWAVPGFRDPTNSKDGQQHAEQTTGGDEKPVEPPGFWKAYTTPSDTYAQWIAAFSALFSVGVSTWAVWLVRSTLELNRQATAAAVEANQLSRQTFIADQRAWIEIEGIEIISPLKWDHEKRQGKVSVKFTVKNIGRTLAKGVWINATFVSFLDRRDTLLAEIYGQNKHMPKSLGASIFPGKNITQVHHLTIEKSITDAISKNFQRDVWEDQTPTPIRLAICVHYWLVVSDERHQTGGIIELVRADMPGNMAYGPGYGDTPANKLGFQKGIDGDFNAD
ncbi:hypothetical protein [Mesorhizobium sp. LNJC403B00]|uniref:hypothetical protein n=1 Tax=Mesorhizobium sp. LNJC403B00 TaxID=1287280 RepID=UPI0003CEE1B4|nr:hypothetical protein [Mesorhizobium sp. LNJC403B00]ESX92818.1 hypothetical protein X754_17630 [Mesorhizobium sp. LNJC403B00]